MSFVSDVMVALDSRVMINYLIKMNKFCTLTQIWHNIQRNDKNVNEKICKYYINNTNTLNIHIKYHFRKFIVKIIIKIKN